MHPSLPASPASQVPPAPADPELPRFSHGAAVAAVLALLPLAGAATLIAMAAAGADVDDDLVVFTMAIATGGAFVGFFWAIVTSIRLKRAAAVARGEPEEPRRGRWLAVLAIPVSLLSSCFGALVVFVASVEFSRGRQLRERGRAVFAPLHEADGEGWLENAADAEGAALVVPDDERDAIASAWRQNGKTEHASVAAFARLAAQLVALGAPPRLIEDAHRDALDEIRHARLCFSLARAVDGRALEPGALPAAQAPSLLRFSRTAALVHLAVESLLDGALNEGVSARAVAKLARKVDDDRVRAVLLAIARDEGRHAAHGWHVLEWCLREGGDVVAAAVRGALCVVPRSMASRSAGATGASAGDEGAAGHEAGRWEAYGLPGGATLEQSYAEVRASLMVRAHALVQPDDAHAAA